MGDRRRTELATTLDEHRVRFATTLLGRWASVQGTFDVVQKESWEFCLDGRLVVMDAGARGEPEVYRWESAGAFRVRLGLLPGDADRGESPDDGTWTTVHYEFALLAHDAGEQIVLREIGREGFWLSLAPLGRVDD